VHHDCGFFEAEEFWDVLLDAADALLDGLEVFVLGDEFQ